MSKFLEWLGRIADVANEAKKGWEKGQMAGAILSSDHSATGYLQGTEDYDLFQVNMAEAGHYRFILTQPIFCDFDFALLTEAGEVIAADNSDRNPSIIDVQGRGSCFVVVRSARGEGEYALAMKKLS